VDFFTPIVDDPFTFGEIAVANALSDVYAMGGRPLCAMNLVGFPRGKLSISVLREILAGGLSKMVEADVVLVGGHSLDDPELKYGLSVTGTVHPDRVLTNVGAVPGDALVLTKALGTGVVNTALKRGRASAAVMDAVVASMATLNRGAMEQILQAEVHACTDVTGFGLLGHVGEMVQRCDVGIAIDSQEVPLFAEAVTYGREGYRPGGLKRNAEHFRGIVDVAPTAAPEVVDLLWDPQTSGGLLAAVPASAAPALLERLRGVSPSPAIVGEVIPSPPGRVLVR
jgi:selenide,water dikinase